MIPWQKQGSYRQEAGGHRCTITPILEGNGTIDHLRVTIPPLKGAKKAELEAARYALSKKNIPQCELTFYEAAEQYITDRESILAPSTVREYRRMMKSTFDELGGIKISKLSPELIQQFINHKSAQNAPKTVRNIHGLISAVLKVYAPSTNLNTALPQKIPPKLYIPTDDDIKKLIDSIDNDDMMIAVLLAAFGPLRRSEICGLESTDFNGNVAHIQRAVVLDKNNNWVDKTTKSIAGNRYVPFPSFVCSLIQERSGRIIRLKPQPDIRPVYRSCKGFRTAPFQIPRSETLLRFHPARDRNP